LNGAVILNLVVHKGVAVTNQIERR
jgi:hypothetical protein